MINLIEHTKNCIELAELYQSKLNNSTESPLICNKTINGLIGEKTQHFYNNLLSIDGIKYLEIGCWQGASTFAAMYDNATDIVVIDNWSEFGGKLEFKENFDKYVGSNRVVVYDDDSFLINTSNLPNNFNIYMYDGNHSVSSQYYALTYYINNLDNEFIYIVDDWNWGDVREGTHMAIQDLGLNILYSKEMRFTIDNTHTPHNDAYKNWWNGIGIFVLSKSTK
jgi:hypothetical protein